MADVKLLYDDERLTLGDLLKMEEDKSIRAQMEVLAKLVMNGDGSYLPEDEGFEALKQFSLAEMRRAADEIQAAAQGADSPK